MRAYISRYACTAANVKIEFASVLWGALPIMHISHMGCFGIMILERPSLGSGIELDHDLARFGRLIVMYCSLW